MGIKATIRVQLSLEPRREGDGKRAAQTGGASHGGRCGRIDGEKQFSRHEHRWEKGEAAETATRVWPVTSNGSCRRAVTTAVGRLGSCHTDTGRMESESLGRREHVLLKLEPNMKAAMCVSTARWPFARKASFRGSSACLTDADDVVPAYAIRGVHRANRDHHPRAVGVCTSRNLTGLDPKLTAVASLRCGKWSQGCIHAAPMSPFDSSACN